VHYDEDQKYGFHYDADLTTQNVASECAAAPP
jgi:hypothetical protein